MAWMTANVVNVVWHNRQWKGYVHEACVNNEMLQLGGPGSPAFIDRPDLICPVCDKPIEVYWQE